MFNCEVYSDEIEGKKPTAVKGCSYTVLGFEGKKLKINGSFIPRSHLLHEDALILVGYSGSDYKSPAIFITDRNMKEYNYKVLNKDGEFYQAIVANCELWACGTIDGYGSVTIKSRNY